MLYGYARVSTRQQDTALQVTALRAAGVTRGRLFEEQRMGVGVRPVLEELLGRLRPGDAVLVYKIDRLARSLSDLLAILARIKAAGATFRSLTEPFETQTVVGRMVLQLLGVVAEFERGVIRERCEAGRIDARARGVQFGRRPAVSHAQVSRLVRSGLTLAQTAARLNVDRSTVRRALRRSRRCDQC
jgi:DNA invertase Pin-like site-specific DNA recombinase